MILAIGFLLTIYFGYLITRLVSSELNYYERTGLSYILGLGFLTWIVYITSSLGVKINLGSILALLISLIVLLNYILIKFKPKYSWKFLPIQSWTSLTKTEKYLLLAIGLLIFFSFLNALYWPVNQWDALVLYDFRAKIILEKGYFIQIAQNYEYFAHYPLLTSLAHTWTYLLGGKNPQFIYSTFLLSFLLVFYGAVRRFSSRLISLVFVLLIISTPIVLHHSTFAYTNLPYMIYLVLGLIYLYNFLISDKKSYLVLAAFLVGLSTWTRQHEPFWMSSILVLLIHGIVKKNYRYFFLYLSIFLTIFGSWKYYEMGLVSESYANPDYVSFSRINLARLIDVNRLKDTLVFLYKSVFASWGTILPLVFLVIISNMRKIFKKKEAFLLIIIAINLLILIGGTYIFTFTYPTWQQIPDSARRMAMFFIPLFIYYVGISEFTQNCFKIRKRLKRS